MLLGRLNYSPCDTYQFNFSIERMKKKMKKQKTKLSLSQVLNETDK